MSSWRIAAAATALIVGPLMACSHLSETEQRNLDACRNRTAILTPVASVSAIELCANPLPSASQLPAPTVPHQEECTSEDIRFRLYPDGRMQYTPDDKNEHPDWALCLKSAGYTPAGNAAPSWTSGVTVRVTKQGGYIEDFPKSGDPPLGAGATIKLWSRPLFDARSIRLSDGYPSAGAEARRPRGPAQKGKSSCRPWAVARASL